MKPIHIKIAALACLIGLACTTKVSEWVLLNAEPNQYTLVRFYKNAPGEEEKSEFNNAKEGLQGSNIHFTEVQKNDVSQPYYGLYYENRLFSRYDDPAQFKGVASSPVRDRIAAEIMKGKLCVMLYLQSGTKEKDDKGLAALRKAVAASPFAAIIPVMELGRDDASEKHFISMLLNVESDLKTLREPMLFGIFGKFKALEPLVGNGISEENINYMIEFLTADCSCLIKDDLPGTDILYNGKWDSPPTALVNAILDADSALMHR